MSGLSRTPGKRVWDNIPTGVRIPPSPPHISVKPIFLLPFLVLSFTKLSNQLSIFNSVDRTLPSQQALYLSNFEK